MAKDAVVRFKKCKHLVTCMDCAVQMDLCPQCRHPIGYADRLMLNVDGSQFGSILLYNPIWIVTQSDWECVNAAFGENEMVSTLAYAMLTNQTVFYGSSSQKKNNLWQTWNSKALQKMLGVTVLPGCSLGSLVLPHCKKHFFRAQHGDP